MTEKQWVVAELTKQGEEDIPERVSAVLRGQLGDDVDIFVPAQSFSRRGNYMTICLMEGYVFIEGGKPAGTYLDLEGSLYISRILTRDETYGRYLVYVGDNEVQTLRERLLEQTRREFRAGDEVEVIEGVYENLEGTVLSVDTNTKKAMIKIHDLVSINTVVELPLQFLAQAREED